jgi:hypothetical protein
MVANVIWGKTWKKGRNRRKCKRKGKKEERYNENVNLKGKVNAKGVKQMTKVRMRRKLRCVVGRGNHYFWRRGP